MFIYVKRIPENENYPEKGGKGEGEKDSNWLLISIFLCLILVTYHLNDII